MNEIDKKIKENFPDESVYKTPKRYNIFLGKNIPSFIKDWLIRKFSDETGELDEIGLINFLDNHIPKKGSKLKGRLVSDHEDITILARIVIEPDIKLGILKFAIPDLGIKINEGIVPHNIVQEHPELKGGEVWGVVTLRYFPPDEGLGRIEIIDYKPFKPYDVDLEYFREIRQKFTLSEWIDLLIRSMEYNPEGFKSLEQKLEFISRLLIFVEPRLNLIELAPKGTGKSYVFGNLSKYGWHVSGGVVTRAKLFYDIQKNMLGMIVGHDFVAMDEIQTISLKPESEVIGALKNYLESGVFTVANIKQTSQAGFILLGNIPLNSFMRPKDIKYMKELPHFFKESALLDRFHGFIEGWLLPRMQEDLKVRGYTLNVEYFSEILHSLRDKTDFSYIVGEMLDIPKNADTRDTNAVKRLSTAYLKLLFPHVKNPTDINKMDFNTFCLEPSLKKRGIIKKQISIIDDEFDPQLPNIKVKDYF